MEGEKERQWEQQEEKESNEAEDDTRSDDETYNEEEDANPETAVVVWQEGHEKDELGNPIMHWEALSLCIAELEKQEEEKRAKAGASLEQGSTTLGWTEDREITADSWEDGHDACNSHVLGLTSRSDKGRLRADSKSFEDQQATQGREEQDKASCVLTTGILKAEKQHKKDTVTMAKY
ncbi:hypothetical protein ATANTOWER_021983 [Ataeniobius toweri]|uniref:Uncharacterized protein n=1 Tax=Ataeniobius toweri TaxID=208326 RepID=A0ABU7BAK3_9TELE|nr:hypothetical protein [Ataeniobius toweri]